MFYIATFEAAETIDFFRNLNLQDLPWILIFLNFCGIANYLEFFSFEKDG